MYFREDRVAQVFLLCAVLLLGGCGTRLPRIEPLAEPDRSAVRERFYKFAEQQPVQALDADVHLQWSVFGRHGSVDGTVQSLRNGSFRVNILDPLGRPVFIGTGYGGILTVIEVASAKAFQSPLYGNLWHEYVPAKLTSDRILPLLLGRVPLDYIDVAEIGTIEEQREGVWLSLLEEGFPGRTHRFFFDPLQSVILQYVLADGNREPLVSILYKGYHLQEDYRIPSLIEISGEAVHGSYTIDLTKVYSLESIAPAAFSVTIPEHFSVESVP